MADNNVADTTEDGQRKQVLSDNGIIIPSLMGSNRPMGSLHSLHRLHRCHLFPRSSQRQEV